MARGLPCVVFVALILCWAIHLQGNFYLSSKETKTQRSHTSSKRTPMGRSVFEILDENANDYINIMDIEYDEEDEDDEERSEGIY